MTSLAAQLAAYFQARPGRWMDGKTLATVAGGYAWRTRVSDLRRPPFSMHIENRVTSTMINGRRYKNSLYRYVPATYDLKERVP